MRRNGLFWGSITLLLGVLLLLGSLGVLPVQIRTLWPVVLIIAGAWFVVFRPALRLPTGAIAGSSSEGTRDRRFRLSLRALLVAPILGLLITVILGGLVQITLSLVLQEDLTRWVAPGLVGLWSTTPLRVRLILTAVNTLGLALGGYFVGRWGLGANAMSVAASALIGMGLLSLLNALYQSTGSAGLVVNDALTWYEYIGEPLITAMVAYWAFRPRRTRSRAPRSLEDES